MKNQSAIAFSERSDRLAHVLGLSLRELASKVGISQAMLFAYRTGKNPISKKAWAKIEAAEIGAGIQQSEHTHTAHHSVSEQQSPYLLKGRQAPSGREKPFDRVESSSLKLNRAFRDRPEEPTPEKCLTYFSEYLTYAAQIPGMVGHIWILLQKNFPVDEVKRLAEAEIERE